MYQLPDGTKIRSGQTFEIDGEKFSPIWLRYATNADLVAKGIARYTPPVPERGDDRFYYNNPDGPVAKPLAQITPVLIAAIKAHAGSLIEERYPGFKQLNMLASGVKLQDIYRTAGTWTTQQQASADTLDAAWAWVKSVRDHSNALEAEVLALDFAGLETWEQHDWPVNPDAPVEL